MSVCEQRGKCECKSERGSKRASVSAHGSEKGMGKCVCVSASEDECECNASEVERECGDVSVRMYSRCRRVSVRV